MSELLTVERLLALMSLSALEIVLGIDNIVFIAIVTGKLPKSRQPRARRIGLGVAMISRILLLLGIAWLAQLTKPLMTVWEHGYSGRDLILIVGGLFLIGKATFEIHGTIESNREAEAKAATGSSTFAGVILQILFLDMIFSLDSVITAVGMANDVTTMVAAIVLSVSVMMLFANPGRRIRHQTSNHQDACFIVSLSDWNRLGR